MKRAQSSVDFLIVCAVFLLIFAVLFQFLLKDYLVESTEKHMQLSARTEAEKVAFAIENVFLVGNGSSSSFYLPSTLAKNTDYNITVFSGVILVSYRDRGYTFVLPTKAVNRSFLTSGLHNVTNVNGVLYIA